MSFINIINFHIKTIDKIDANDSIELNLSRQLRLSSKKKKTSFFCSFSKTNVSNFTSENIGYGSNSYLFIYG